MDYFIMDLEWNTPAKEEQLKKLQASFPSLSWKKWPKGKDLLTLPEKQLVPMRYEIIEFAALPKERAAKEMFHSLIKPQFYEKIQYRIYLLTGHQEQKLKHHGKIFSKVWQNFCKKYRLQKAPCFLIWGFSDAEILYENLRSYENKTPFALKNLRFVDLQFLFSRYFYHYDKSLSLQRALEIAGFYAPKNAHTAKEDTASTKKIYEAMKDKLGFQTLERLLEKHSYSLEELFLWGMPYVIHQQEQDLKMHRLKKKLQQLLALLSVKKHAELALENVEASQTPTEESLAEAEQSLTHYAKQWKKYKKFSLMHLTEKEQSKRVSDQKKAKLSTAKNKGTKTYFKRKNLSKLAKKQEKEGKR